MKTLSSRGRGSSSSEGEALIHMSWEAYIVRSGRRSGRVPGRLACWDEESL